MIKIKIRTARLVTASIVVLLVVLSAIFKFGYGTICSLGVWRICFTCPLGYLQAALASRDLLTQLWLPVGLVLLSVVILGRFFCAWICPTALLRDVSGGQRTGPTKGPPEGRNHLAIQPHAFSSPEGFLQVRPNHPTWASYSPYAVLGGTLLSSLLFGFPVFCAVCPIGLFFGSLFAVTRLFSDRQPSLELVLLPVLLGLEIFALKSWCRSICPLGALLGLVGGLNRFLRPRVVKDKCLVSKGIPCQVCRKECPEGIVLVHDTSLLKDCTKCLECYDKCPAKAIRLALLG